MAVTQYIGARYVPLIYQNPDDNSNTWKAGVAYEPLTVVSWAGGSYTSKAAVPAGASNPVDAPEYWVSIGLYSGQTSINTNNISSIQHALANATEAGYVCTTARNVGDLVWINGVLYRCTAAVNVDDAYVEGINITPILDALKNITDAVTQNTNDIGDLADATDDLSNEVDELAERLSDPFTLIIGDSYGEGYDPNGNNSGWCEYLRLKGITNYQIIYRGGMGFHYADSDTRSIYYVVSNTAVPHPEKVTQIIIAIGYNDFKANGTDVVSHGVSFMSYLRTRFTNAKIFLGMCGFAWTLNENAIVSSDISTTIADYLSICRNSDAIFMPQCSGALLGAGPSSMSSGDYKHPTELGNKAIANAIWAAIHGESFTQKTNYTIPFSNSSIGLTGELFLPITVQDGVVSGRVKFNSFAINTGTAQSLFNLAGNAAHLPCFPYDCFIQAASYFHNFDTSSGLAKSFIQTPIFVNPSSGNIVSINFILMNDSGSNFGASKHVEINDASQYGFSVAY